MILVGSGLAKFWAAYALLSLVIFRGRTEKDESDLSEHGQGFNQRWIIATNNSCIPFQNPFLFPLTSL
jgi:hypothetical protein